MARSLLLPLLALALTAPAFAQPAAGGVLINEIRTDQAGSDNDEFFELFGTPGTDLSTYTYLVIGDGATGSGTVEYVFSLAGVSIPADGILLVGGGDDGDGMVFGVAADVSEDPNFENSDNVTHVLVTGFTGADGDDLDTDDDGTLDSMPWSAVSDAVSLVEVAEPVPGEDDYYYAEQLGGEAIGPDGTFAPGHVYRDGVSLEWQIGVFDPPGDTPGEPNPSTVAVESGAPDRPFALEAPFPNPARGAATVAFTLDTPSDVRLAVYDVLGRRLAVLAEGARAAARHTVALDAAGLSAGVYVVRLEVDGQVATRTLSVAR